MPDELDEPDEHVPSGARPDADPGAGLSGRDLIGLGGLLVGAVVLGLVVGLVVDDAAGTSPVFTLVGIFLGVVAGAVAFVLRVRTALRG